MTVGVLTGVTHRLEADLVTALERAPGVSVLRRCADLAELLAAGAGGIAEVAVVSADLRGLDREALRHLAGHGVRVAGVVSVGDDEGEQRLRQLGVAVVVHPDDDVADIGAAVSSLVAEPSPEPPPSSSSSAALGPPPAGEGGVWSADPAQAGVPAWARGPLAPPPGAPPPGLAVPDLGGAVPTAMGPGDDPVPGGPDGGDEQVFVPSVPTAVRRGRITAVWGPTGAPGRTTVAVTVAAHLAQRGIESLLVDLDTYGASVAQVLALLDEAPGVAAAARASEQGTLDVPGLARLSPQVTPRMRVLTGLPRADRWPEVRAAAVEHVLDLAREVADHIVVDCGFAIEDDEELSYDTAAPRRNAAVLTALAQADEVVVVGAADPVGLQRLVRAVQELAVVQAPQPVVVVNKVRESIAGPRPEKAIGDVLSRFAGLEELHFVPWAPAECDAALLAGRTLVEQAPAAEVTLAIGRVVHLVHPSWRGAATPARPSRRAGLLRR